MFSSYPSLKSFDVVVIAVVLRVQFPSLVDTRFVTPFFNGVFDVGDDTTCLRCVAPLQFLNIRTRHNVFAHNFFAFRVSHITSPQTIRRAFSPTRRVLLLSLSGREPLVRFRPIPTWQLVPSGFLLCAQILLRCETFAFVIP